MRKLYWLLLLLTLLLALGAGPSWLGAQAQAEPDQNPPGEAVAVYYVHPAGGWELSKDPVYRALTLTDRLRLVDNLEQAQAVVANDERPSPRAISAVRDRGLGLVLFAGSRLDVQLPALFELGLSRGLGYEAEAISIEPVPGVDDPLIEQIAWTSAPQIKARSPVIAAPGAPPLQALLQTEESHNLILGRTQVGQGQVYVLTPWPTTDQAHNPALLEWPYWNYLVYHLTVRAAGETPLSFADYPGSPVPHAAAKTALALVLGVMLLGTSGAFVLVRRHSRRHPDMLERIVSNAKRYSRVEKSAWELVGFHRPLAGFLFLVAVGLVLFIVLMAYREIVLYRTLLPSAQARGAWSSVTTFFHTFWVFFDWGTAAAFVKFFAEYRVDDPVRGIKYAQLYVWWQAITGTVQLGLVTLAAAFIVPHTPYAFLSYYLILHALIQFPGFLSAFQFAFRAFQKHDYDQMINFVNFLAPVFVQSATVFVLARWGAANPVFGKSVGGVLGLGLGAYLTQWVIFGVGYGLLKRLGYNAKVLFMAHFDRETLVSALRFGAPLMVAGVVGSLGYSIQTLLITNYLLNWTEVQGNWSLVADPGGGLLIAYSAIAGLYYGLMPSISEAFNHGRLTLTRYYIAQGFKYGGFFSAFIASALIGVGDRFILGALGDDYQRAAGLMLVMGLWGMLQFPAWFADRLQEGTGRPSLQMWMLIMEQSIRIVLMFFLLESLQLTGLILAYLVALPTKGVVAWLINRKLILPFRIYWWQTLVAPALAGLVNLGLLRLVGASIWGGDMITSVILFFVALLPSLPVFCFFAGLFGAWDDAGLSELAQAAGLSSLGKPISWLIYHSSRLGTRLSPLHGRFPIDIYGQAQAEAASLTAEKVSLLSGAGQSRPSRL